MAGAVIKIGANTNDFQKQISEVNKQLKVTTSQFGVTAKEAELFGSATDQLKAQQQELTAKITAQNKILDIYQNRMSSLNSDISKQKATQTELSQKIADTTKKYNESVKATGEESQQSKDLKKKLEELAKQYNQNEKDLAKSNKQLDDSVIKMNNTKKSLLENKKALESVNDELANSKIDAFTKKIENLGNKTKDFGDKVQNIGSKLTTGITLPTVGLFTGATAGMQELRLDMSKFEQNVKNAGISTDVASDSLSYFNAITGETDSSIEAVSNLLASGFSNSQLQQAVDNLGGAVVKFPDTLKIESLADSMQETLATGKATGQYAELLERLGINLDTFNSGLIEANKNGIGQQYVLDTLAKNGLAEVNAQYKETNKETIKGAENQQKMKQSFMQLGTTLQPVMTTITGAITNVINKFNSLGSGTQKTILGFLGFAAILGPTVSFFGNVSKAIGGVSKAVDWMSKNLTIANIKTKILTATTKIMTIAQKGLNFVMKMNPVGLVIIGITALIAIIATLWNKSEGFRNFCTKAWADIQQAFASFNEFLTNIFSTDWTESFGVFGNILNSFFANCSNIWKSIKQVFSGIVDFVAGVFTGDWSRAWEGVKSIFGGIFNGLISIAKAPINGVIGLLNFLIDCINSIDFDIPDWVPLIGGSNFGFNISHIGYLENGGILTRPTFAGGFMAGERNKGRSSQQEAVIPLDVMYKKIDSIVANRMQQPAVIYTTNIVEVGGREVTRSITKEVVKDINNSKNNYNLGRGRVGYV